RPAARGCWHGLWLPWLRSRQARKAKKRASRSNPQELIESGGLLSLLAVRVRSRCQELHRAGDRSRSVLRCVGRVSDVCRTEVSIEDSPGNLSDFCPRDFFGRGTIVA